ncbi:MAG TPA: class I SAM-dependent methyltransferase [Bacteroidales bacterium]|nr:class I SAM-dependent methyltransferase [Bacteroidales bacterium]HPT12066.1 class I SAM-dependent methyltransferase [Bacteroidales bacterium]
MNEFDIKAKEWDDNPERHERSEAIAGAIIKSGILRQDMNAMEFGTGTGMLSFLLADRVKEIIMVDTSAGMIEQATSKIKLRNTKNLFPILLDLQNERYTGISPDFIFSQMVLHHIPDTKAILKRFHELLNSNGYLAIADLYAEDGSFHGDGADVHKGFDIAILEKELENIGFNNIQTSECYRIRKTSGNATEEYPVFLMIARK